MVPDGCVRSGTRRAIRVSVTIYDSHIESSTVGINTNHTGLTIDSASIDEDLFFFSNYRGVKIDRPLL